MNYLEYFTQCVGYDEAIQLFKNTVKITDEELQRSGLLDRDYEKAAKILGDEMGVTPLNLTYFLDDCCEYRGSWGCFDQLGNDYNPNLWDTPEKECLWCDGECYNDEAQRDAEAYERERRAVERYFLRCLGAI